VQSITVSPASGASASPHFCDAPLAQPQVAPHIQRLRRVEQASVFEQVAVHHDCFLSNGVESRFIENESLSIAVESRFIAE
jgi:hypothetical protein